MTVILLSHSHWLADDGVASGNAVRAYWLARALAERGIAVQHLYPASLGEHPGQALRLPPRVDTAAFAYARELEDWLRKLRPAAAIVGYWELLAELPRELDIPVVLDCVAPRLLEVLYEPERRLDSEIQRALSLYPRAERFLVGNRRQWHALVPWLIMAGFDCRRDVPIDIVPLAAAPAEAGAERGGDAPVRFVAGGVDWPWRDAERYHRTLARALAADPREGRLTLLSGRYVHGGATDDRVGDDRVGDFCVETAAATGRARGADATEQLGLMSYAEHERFLREQADVGLELAAWNVEREHSQSFRALEMLRHGIPLICNRYLPLAELIERYDAGWLIDKPRELSPLATELLARPPALRGKGDNARRLVAEALHYRSATQPLANYLNDAVPAARYSSPPVDPAALGPPSDAAKARNLVHERRGSSRAAALGRELLATGLHWIRRLLARRGEVARQRAREICVITRADLFPVNHGAAVKIVETARALSQRVGRVWLVTDERGRYLRFEDGELHEHRFPLWLRWLAPPRLWVRLALILKGLPRSNAFLYFPLSDWSYILRVLYIARRHPVGTFMAEFPGYARAAIWGRRIYGGRVITAEHNVEYRRLADQLPDLSDAAYRKLRDIEIGLCNLSDAVVTVSVEDRERLLADGAEPSRLEVIPHGVDCDAFANATPIDLRARYGIAADRPVLVYHGTYCYPPNREAIDYFAAEILPRLQARGLHPVLLAMGRHAPGVAPGEDIVYTGAVDDLPGHLAGADAAVVPLLEGGGTRMKILDYFAAGLPVVSTGKGIEGIAVTADVEALIADTPEALADHLASVLQDRELARRLGGAGRAFVEPLSWQAIAQRYLALMGASGQQ